MNVKVLLYLRGDSTEMFFLRSMQKWLHENKTKEILKEMKKIHSRKIRRMFFFFFEVVIAAQCSATI